MLADLDNSNKYVKLRRSDVLGRDYGIWRNRSKQRLTA